MTNARYSNGSLFVQFADGDFSLTTCGKDFALQVIAMIEEGSSKEELLIVLNPEFEKLQKEVDQIKKENEQVELILDSVLNDDRFYLSENKLYRQGIPLSIPKVLAEKISGCITNNDHEELNRLDKFWAWCSLIKTAEVRESFYTYITKNKLILTNEGFVIGYRTANKVESNSGLVDFVGIQYQRLSKNKKSTTVDVWECTDEDGKVYYSLKDQENDCRVVGILKDLFKNTNIFEDTYHSDHKDENGQPVVYKIGVETRLKDEDVDWDPNKECSRGLHGHLGNYSDQMFGDTRFFFVMNPADTAACPYQDYSKFRMAALTPIGIMGTDQQDIDDFVLTEDMEEIISKTMSNHLIRLEELSSKKFQDTPHTLLKEVPNIDFKNLFTVIKETVNPSVVKERYTKL